MRAFEFHFNPKDKDRLIFDSFCYVPENVYERRMGGLFMIGELKNPLPHNYRFLERLAAVIKKEFYSKFQRTEEQSLKESLKRANEFLAQEVARENTDWLGNLNFAIISLKNFNLNFTKIGAIKMFLIRGQRVMNIGAKLDGQEIEPYPLKVFNNIVSGKLKEEDVIASFSEGIFPLLKNAIAEIGSLTSDEKNLSAFINAKRKDLADTPGSFVLINTTKAVTGKRPKIIFEREIEKFQMKQALSPFSKYSKKTVSSLKNILALAKSSLGKWFKSLKPKTAAKTKETSSPSLSPKTPVKIKVKVEKTEKTQGQKYKIFKFKLPFQKLSSLMMPFFNKRKLGFKLPAFKVPVFNFSKIKKNQILQKRSIVILLFIFVLTAGFFIFQGQEKQRQKNYLAQIEIIREKVSQAEAYIILKDTNPDAKRQALSLLSLAWNEIVPMTKLDGAARKEALSLKRKIDNDLKNLNNLVKIEEPELVFEFNRDEFIPQRIISDGENLYFFSQYVPNIIKIDKDKNKSTIWENQKFNEACRISSNFVLLLSKPDILTSIKNGQIEERLSLTLISSDFETNKITSFQESVYLLDSTTGEIAKYSIPLQEGKDSPQKWFFSKYAERPAGAKSIAVDGSLWILNKENNLLRYYAGNLQETISPTVFPEPENFSKILIPYGSPYIFILEPAQKRVVVLDKEGKVFTQFESEKFDSLLDFTVSEDTKTIWLLNGLNAYKINL